VQSDTIIELLETEIVPDTGVLVGLDELHSTQTTVNFEAVGLGDPR
jgi:hypothetical protein